MASNRAPLGPHNVDYHVTRKPKKSRSVIPQYDKGDLLDTLRFLNDNYADSSVQVRIVEEDLTRPTPDRIHQIYFMLLNVQFRCTPDSFRQTPFAAKPVSHPELYDDFQYRINFLRAMSRLMKYCLLHGAENDFTFRDLLEPNPKRTVRLLSAIVNYLKFLEQLDSESQGPTFMEMNAKVDEKIQSSLLKHSELQSQLSALRRQKEQEQSHEEELRCTIKDQEQQLLCIKQTQEHLEAKLRNLETEQQSCQQQLEKVNGELAKHHARVEELRTMVVSSPDKLKASLAAVNKEHDTTSALVAGAQSLATMWEGLRSKAEQVVPTIASLQESIDMLISRSEKNTELTLTLESSEQIIIRLKQDLREATSRHQNLHRRLNALKEEHEQLQLDNQRRPARRNECLQSEVQLLCNELSIRKNQEAKALQEIEELKSLLAQSKVEYEKYDSQLSMLLTALNNAFSTHQKKIEACEDRLSQV